MINENAFEKFVCKMVAILYHTHSFNNHMDMDI